MKVKSMLHSGVSAWLELFVVGSVSKPYLIILQGDQWWGVKWRTGGVLTWHFLIQNTAGNPKSFSQASTLALLRSQWSFSVHWAEVIRFPTHTVSVCQWYLIRQSAQYRDRKKSNCYREHSLWVFLSMTSTLRAFMHAFINVPFGTCPT